MLNVLGDVKFLTLRSKKELQEVAKERDRGESWDQTESPRNKYGHFTLRGNGV